MGLLEMLTGKLQSGIAEVNDRTRRFLGDITRPPKQFVPPRGHFLLDKFINAPTGWQNDQQAIQAMQQDQARMANQPGIQGMLQRIPTERQPTQQEAANFATLNVVQPSVAGARTAPVATPTPRPAPVAVKPNLPVNLQSFFNQKIGPASAQASVPVRNNNPGNVRPGGIADKYASGVDENGFLRFDSPEVGIKAVKEDLYAKLFGESKFRAKLGDRPTVRTLWNTWANPELHPLNQHWGPNVMSILSEITGQNVTLDTDLTQLPFDAIFQAIGRQEGWLQ